MLAVDDLRLSLRLGGDEPLSLERTGSCVLPALE